MKRPTSKWEELLDFNKRPALEEYLNFIIFRNERALSINFSFGEPPKSDFNIHNMLEKSIQQSKLKSFLL